MWCKLPCPLLLHHLLAAFIKIKIIQYGCLGRMALKNIQNFNTLRKSHLEMKDGQKISMAGMAPKNSLKT
jgi:hypothetical protein